ncbi:hypothetical protein GTN66_04120 [bacterium]|nr:hypothetical protein [bacterium]NIO73588.1 hypothetical protein [bacterium]
MYKLKIKTKYGEEKAIQLPDFTVHDYVDLNAVNSTSRKKILDKVIEALELEFDVLEEREPFKVIPGVSGYLPIGAENAEHNVLKTQFETGLDVIVVTRGYKFESVEILSSENSHRSEGLRLIFLEKLSAGPHIPPKINEILLRIQKNPDVTFVCVNDWTTYEFRNALVNTGIRKCPENLLYSVKRFLNGL